ncbi:hypothetical protein DYB32_007081 [Aphanomyces invadans]|uniref:Amino acid transporter n=1 Tax=Aphanomyces invadans TaxID=157072 RepID=A0A3R7CX77_9STRA|nr:hypothetical protein DYB32_007081 [Aphanomyces invadans]
MGMLPTRRNLLQERESSAWWWRFYLGAPGTLVGAGFGLLLAYILTTEDIKIALKTCDASFDRLCQRSISRLGILYLRALTCVVFPQAFVNVVLVAAEISGSSSRRVGRAGWRVVAFSLCTTLLVVGQGFAFGMLFLDRFQGSTYTFRQPTVLLRCPTAATTFLQMNATTRELNCAPFNGTIESKIAYLLSDLDHVFEIDPKVNRFRQLETSLPEVIEVLFKSQTPFTDAININLVHLVLGAASLGLAVGSLSRTTDNTLLLACIRELAQILEIMTSWVVSGLPIALMSLIATPISMATHNVFVASASNDLVRLVWYLVCFGIVSAIHALVVLPLILIVWTRGQVNPWRYLLQVKGALLYNAGTSSTRAGHTVLASSIDRTMGFSPSLTSRFALDVGISCNKGGGGLYICLSTLWIFSNAGLLPYLTPSKLVLIVVLSTLGSYAVVPVRNGGVAIVMCAFAMLSGLSNPYAMNFLLLAECILDPLCTALNAWSNAVATRIVVFLKRD